MWLDAGEDERKSSERIYGATAGEQRQTAGQACWKATRGRSLTTVQRSTSNIGVVII